VHPGVWRPRIKYAIFVPTLGWTARQKLLRDDGFAALLGHEIDCINAFNSLVAIRQKVMHARDGAAEGGAD
jgi:hypothetical protein